MKDQYHQLKMEGRAEGDTNFCTVIALGIAADLNYNEASSIMEEYGRKYRKGSSGVDDALQDLGFRLESQDISATTVKGLMSLIENDGMYIVHIRGHVFIIKNGIIQDWVSPHKAFRILSVDLLKDENDPEHIVPDHLVEKRRVAKEKKEKRELGVSSPRSDLGKQVWKYMETLVLRNEEGNVCELKGYYQGERIKSRGLDSNIRSDIVWDFFNRENNAHVMHDKEYQKIMNHVISWCKSNAIPYKNVDCYPW